MEANIFKNAKFGDMFITRDGRMAIYWRKLDYYHRLISDELSISLIVRDDGRLQIGENHNSDIVGEWQESINEEELAENAEKYAEGIPMSVEDYFGNPSSWSWEDITNAYKAGYRKAKQNGL